MICYRCGTENPSILQQAQAGPGSVEVHYCKQCGADLWNGPAGSDDGARKSLIHVLILVGWEYFTHVAWLVLPRMVQRVARSGFVSMSSFYKVVSWGFGGVELVLLVLFAALARNMTARICLIVFMAVRLLLLIAYTVN